MNKEKDSELVLSRLTNLSKESLLGLYRDESSCKAVFRLLPPIAQQIVVRLLLLPDGIDFNQFASTRGDSEVYDSIASLKRLLVCTKVEDMETGSHSLVCLNKEFRKHLLRVFSSDERGSINGSESAPPSQSSHTNVKVANSVSIADDGVVDVVGVPASKDLLPSSEAAVHGRSRWTRILRVLAGLDLASDVLHKVVRETLKFSGLLDDNLNPTGAGRCLLLSDMFSQAWEMATGFVRWNAFKSGSRNPAVSGALPLLFRLGFGAGDADGAKPVSADLRKTAAILSEFGFIMPLKGGYSRATPLTLRLIGSIPEQEAERLLSDATRIIVETNHRVYYYTTSELQLVIGELFLKPHFLLPDLAVCSLSRESIKSAYGLGISAQAIISFLRRNVHEAVRKRRDIVPSTIVDQLLLWENEDHRIRTTEAAVFFGFGSDARASASEQYARRHGFLLSAGRTGDGERYVAVSRSAQDRMRRHMSGRPR